MTLHVRAWDGEGLLEGGHDAEPLLDLLPIASEVGEAGRRLRALEVRA